MTAIFCLRQDFLCLSPVGVAYARSIIFSAEAESEAMAQLPSKEIAALARVTAPVAPHMKQGFEDIPLGEKWPSTPPIS